MKRQDTFIMTKEELFAEQLKVCIVADNISFNEHKNMLDYLINLHKEGKIHSLGYRNHKGSKEQIFSIGFALYECLLRYPRGDEKEADKQLKIGNSCEFIRLLTADTVFVFVGDENPLPYKGRLWQRIETFEKPIVFFMRNKDNTSWEPYKACQFLWDEEKEESYEDWCFVGEIEEYSTSEDEFESMEESKKDNRFFRYFSKESMNEREYSIAERSLRINSKCLGLEINSMVMRRPEIAQKAQEFLEKQSEIFIGLQRTENLTEDILNSYEYQLDFMEKELEKIVF